LLTILGHLGIKRAKKNVPARVLVWGSHCNSAIQRCDAELCTLLNSACEEFKANQGTKAAIIPKKELFTPGGIDVGARFFQLTLGHAITNPRHLQTFFSVIKAVSAMGNIIVVTFTAARGILAFCTQTLN
jgi:hypothetical protein